MWNGVILHLLSTSSVLFIFTLLFLFRKISLRGFIFTLCQTVKQICALQSPVFLIRSLLWHCMNRSDLYLVALTSNLFPLSWINKNKSVSIFVVCLSQLWSIIRPIAFYRICALYFYHSPVVRDFILVYTEKWDTLPVIIKACQRNAVNVKNECVFLF